MTLSIRTLSFLTLGCLLISGREAVVLGQTNSPTDRVVDIAATIAFTEGPTVHADGTVYFTDLRGDGRRRGRFRGLADGELGERQGRRAGREQPR